MIGFFISYTWQVMDETLRISPVGPFAVRESPDHELRIQVEEILKRITFCFVAKVASRLYFYF